jgi:ubiquinone/menaquinone biosynthesis C-methylase UbiE
LAAEQAAQQALSLNRHEIVALKVMARVALDAQRYAEVRQVCRRILDRHPQDAEAQQFLSRCPSETAGLGFNSAPPALPAAAEILKSLEQLVGDYTARAQTCRAFGPEHLLQLLTVGDYQCPVAIHPGRAPAPPAADGFPLPPVALTMGYGAGDLDHYLACGRRSYEVLSGLLAAQRVRLEAGDAMLDWGCAAGRALRNFSAEAQRGCRVWGCDVHVSSIAWAQQHLAPPFRFFNSSSLPHLPLADGTFKFIYGLSVMTHLVTMRDLWLLELRRVLRPDGMVVLTVHDENTWAWFRERGWPGWMPPELRVHNTLPGESVDIRGSSWEHCYTFFHTDYIRRVWGQFFTVTDIVPRADCYQSAVILRKT